VTEWLPPYIPPYEVPGYVFPPVGPGTTVKPPCNPETDKECPPPPPDDVPEPATIFMLIVGILGASLAFRRTPKARTN
jgi:hypothetical protein